MSIKRPREDRGSLPNGSGKRRKNFDTDEALSTVFSGFMSSYLKLNWVNEDENPNIPPKYVLSDMIMEKFFKESKWRQVADSRGVVDYINRCLSFHTMKHLDPTNFPKAYTAWKECYNKDFNTMELESAEVLCQLKKVLQKKDSPADVNQTDESEDTKTEEVEANGEGNNADTTTEKHQNPPEVLSTRLPPEIVTESWMNYTNNIGQYGVPHRYPVKTPGLLAKNSLQYHVNSSSTTVVFEDKQTKYNPKKKMFELQVLTKGQWSVLGLFHTHQDACEAFKCIRTTILNVLPQLQIGNPMPPHVPAGSQIHARFQQHSNQMASPLPPTVPQDESTTMVYTLPTQKVIQLIHRLPSINLSDPWQLTQLVCLYLCLFARISIKSLCSLRETHVTVNSRLQPGPQINSNDPQKPFVTVVGGPMDGRQQMCMKHLKCMCAETHDMCNVLCVVTVLTLYQRQKTDVGSSDNQAFVRGIALAPNGVSRCLTQTPLRDTNKLQLAQWLKKITSKFTC